MGRILTGALVLIVGYVSFPLGNSILHFNKPYFNMLVEQCYKETSYSRGKCINYDYLGKK